VKLLVEHGANVNHTTKTHSTPIRGACYNGNVDMARYLIENGADIHANNKNNETNLMVSANYNHIHMVTYLIDEFSWDVNVCDNDGRSVLYDAVHCASLEIVELLLKHGARNFRASIDQMSPLMWAAEKKRPDLVDAISSRCSLLEQIEAEELLGSAFVCAQNNENDLEQAFQHFSRALELRSSHDLPKVLRSVTIEIFDNRQECQTLDELEEIRYNFSNMCTEALLVRERVLGPTNEKYRDSLSYLGALLSDMEQHHKALMLWMYELQLLQQYSISFDSKKLREIVSLISEILLHSMSIPIDASLTLLALISEELNHNTEQFNYNLYTLLFLITIITEV
jgi:Fem-1 family protein b